MFIYSTWMCLVKRSKSFGLLNSKYIKWKGILGYFTLIIFKFLVVNVVVLFDSRFRLLRLTENLEKKKSKDWS